MSGTHDKILVERSGAVTTFVINRHERRNAVDPECAAMLLAAFKAFDQDEEARVGVLTGAGDTFCAGYDLKALADEGMAYEAEGEGPMGPSRLLLGKPLIAAVEGHAVAGGLELALMCDMRVASETAVFGVFCRRWGVPLVDGGTVRLPRIIGQGRALDLILTGRAVDAVEALAIGLANRVTPRGRARAEAEALAREIARFPQACMRSDRLSAYGQWGQSLEEALRAEGRFGEVALRGEALEGAGRFAAGLGRGGRFDQI